MNSQKEFLTLISSTIGLLVVSLFLPDLLAIATSVIYFVAVTWLRPKLLIPMLIIYFPLRPFLLEFNDSLKFAGDAAIITLVVKVIWDAIKQKDYKSIFKLEWYEWAYILFCVSGAIAALITGVSLVAIIFQLRKFLTMYLLYYGVKRLSWGKIELLNVMKLITGIATLISVHGYVEKLSQRQWLLPQAWVEMFISPTNVERIYGLLGNPNSVGLFMFVSIIVSVVLLRTTHKKRWYIPLILSVGTFLLTFSRGSFVGIIVAGIICLVLARNKNLLKQVLISVLAGYILVFLPIQYGDKMIESSIGEKTTSQEDSDSSIGDRFSSSINEENVSRSSNTGRIFYVKKGLQIMADHPIIGTGFGTFGDSAALVYSSPIYDNYGLENIYEYRGSGFYSDNQYIQIMVQTGIIGTILFAVFMLDMLYRIWKTRDKQPQVAHVALFFWIFISVVGIVYNVWENQVFPLIFFALMAWLETIRRGQSDSIVTPGKEGTSK